VELAGALALLMRATLRSEFRRIDPLSARIVLIDGGRACWARSRRTSPRRPNNGWNGFGVQVRLGQGVDHIDEDGVVVAANGSQQDGHLDRWRDAVSRRKVVGPWRRIERTASRCSPI